MNLSHVVESTALVCADHLLHSSHSYSVTLKHDVLKDSKIVARLREFALVCCWLLASIFSYCVFSNLVWGC